MLQFQAADTNCPYTPTPKQIRDECDKFRRGWSKKELRNRGPGDAPAVTIQMIANTGGFTRR